MAPPSTRFGTRSPVARRPSMACASVRGCRPTSASQRSARSSCAGCSNVTSAGRFGAARKNHEGRNHQVDQEGRIPTGGAERRREEPSIEFGVTVAQPPAHLYVHVPFCARRCTYCDFSIAVRRRVPAAEYLEAVSRELMLRSGSTSAWKLETLYFGGGTPSKLGGDGVTRLVEEVRRVATLLDGAEVTLEANPEDVTPATVRAWRLAGVNRLSLGAQSFDDDVLAWMHRTHNAAQV